MKKAVADYSVTKVTDEVVYLQDLNLGRKSVTNDAEAVVHDLHERWPGRRFFYVDTEGEAAELLHVDGVFKDFRIF